MNMENPYDAVISAIMLADDIVNELDESVDNAWDFIINAGTDNGIANGQKYQVFSLGKEIFDPLTQESLGKFEIVKGSAIVTHAQNRMSKLRSTNKIFVRREGLNALASFAGNDKIDYVEKSAPFDELSIGDFVRRV